MKTKRADRRPTLKKMLQKRIVKRPEIKDPYYWGDMITARINSENKKEEK
jgi:hypothetical protein